MRKNVNLKNLFTIFTVLAFLAPFSGQAAEKDLYDFLWLDQDKKVYVLQNKTFKKANTWHFDVGYINNVSADFQDTSGYQVTLGYNWSEEWGLDVVYNSYNNKDTDALTDLNRVNSAMPLIRNYNSSYGAMLRWDPFYGKINTFNKIIYFDWSFGAGVASINAESNARTADISNVDEYDKETYLGGIWKSEIKAHINKNWKVGVQFQQHIILDAKGPLINNTQNTRMETNSDIILSLGFSF